MIATTITPSTEATHGYLGRVALQAAGKPQDHKERIRQELKDLGMWRPGLLRPEARYLPNIIHPDEAIEAIVYGHNEEGLVMLVATDRRAIYLNKKPLFLDEDQVTYDVVLGIDYYSVGPYTTVTLRTQIKDFKVKTCNKACAEAFVDYIESHCLDRKA